MVDKTEKALYDKMQTRLGENCLPIPNNFKFAKKNLSDIVKDKMLICPFCLTPNYLSSFEFDKGLYKCEKCKNRMHESTLINMFNWFNSPIIDSESYAKWVFGYRINGFFQKINFKEWNTQLWKFGISQDFWGYYNKYKGEYKAEQEGEF